MEENLKQLLLKDLCARLPYGVKCRLSVKGADVSITVKLDYGGLEHFFVGTMDVKPYLRPMSSMTDEEHNEYINTFTCMWDAVDYLIEHHLDFRGLIPMGLALEATEGMYKEDE